MDRVCVSTGPLLPEAPREEPPELAPGRSMPYRATRQTVDAAAISAPAMASPDADPKRFPARAAPRDPSGHDGDRPPSPAALRPLPVAEGAFALNRPLPQP
ncbi:hypothetical protein CLV78_101636 [Aliiruegeria haliotis]|uniref:Uncharacterized protein n=1 Tax=Aliiruegeria haliotis TaxID=1280846 RepID=A0A2T0RZE8_9RHOB|nr:hypothetical protein CLV78_101636 [Aliiruegeria haliotis]